MIVIRSVIFNIVFYLVLFVYLIAAMPTLAMPRGALWAMVKSWSPERPCGQRLSL